MNVTLCNALRGIPLYCIREHTWNKHIMIFASQDTGGVFHFGLNTSNIHVETE